MSTDDRFKQTLNGPLAFIADIHGNLAALDAVLSALRDLRAGALYVAGDLVFGGDDPLGVWMRLQEVGARCVRGPTDFALAALEPARMKPKNEHEAARLERFVRTREALGELILARLKRLPEALRIEMPDASEILVVHGSPRDSAECFSHDMTDEEMYALIVDDPADLIVCGGGHIPFVRPLDAVTVACAGSVGEAPGGGVAHYTLVMPSSDGGPTIDQRWVTL